MQVSTMGRIKVRTLFGIAVATASLAIMFTFVVLARHTPTLANTTAKRRAICDATDCIIGLEQGPTDYCVPPPTGFKAWKNNLVTVLQPQVPRNCQKLFNQDPYESNKVQIQNMKWRNFLSDKDLLRMARNCSRLQNYFSDNLYITKLEHSFPIAFTFVADNSTQQILRLLKLLYRPQNHYCIDPYSKASPVFIKIFKSIAKCLKNVHVSSILNKGQWGHHSLMESQMHCMWDLVHMRVKQPKKEKWKYIINLCGKELPLNTNHEIVSHLVRLNGTSAVNAVKVKPNDWKEIDRLGNIRIPFTLPYYKSMTYMALSFKFAHFLLTNSSAIQVYEIFKQCRFPEEHFYATLYMTPNVPGGFNPNIPKRYYFNVDNIFWHHKWHENSSREETCSGKIVHEICIVTVGDMKRILQSSNFGGSALFHNKYFMEHDHTIMDCMEERIIAKNKLEFYNDCEEH